MATKTIKIRSIYDPTEDPGVSFPVEEGMTKQSFKDECDVNHILKRYESTGELPNMIKQDPTYGDFSSMVSYQEALNIVIHAEQQFAALSAEVRDRFANNPAKFLAFMEDAKNVDEIVKLGLGTVRKRDNEPGNASAGQSTPAGTGGSQSGSPAGANAPAGSDPKASGKAGS